MDWKNAAPLQAFTSVLYIDHADFLAVFCTFLRSFIEALYALYAFDADEIADFNSDLFALSQAASNAVFFVVKADKLLLWNNVTAVITAVSLLFKAVFTQDITAPDSSCPAGSGSVVFISVAIATAPRINQIIGSASNLFIR